MKSKRLIVAIIVCLSLFSLGCFGTWYGPGTRVRGSGRIDEETRRLKDFTEVELATIGTLTIEVGNKNELRIEAEDNLLPYFKSEVSGGRLVINTANNTSINTTRPVKYYLTVKELEGIRLSSSGDAFAPDLEARQFEITISSSGDLTMESLEADRITINIRSSGDTLIEEIETETLDVDISSSGNLTIDDGTVEKQTVTLSSSGNYKARGVHSEEANVRVSSSGNATLYVSEYLNARSSSSGNVFYTGNPTVEAHTSSSGDIRKLEE